MLLEKRGLARSKVNRLGTSLFLTPKKWINLAWACKTPFVHGEIFGDLWSVRSFGFMFWAGSRHLNSVEFVSQAIVRQARRARAAFLAWLQPCRLCSVLTFGRAQCTPPFTTIPSRIDTEPKELVQQSSALGSTCIANVRFIAVLPFAWNIHFSRKEFWWWKDGEWGMRSDGLFTGCLPELELAIKHDPWSGLVSWASWHKSFWARSQLQVTFLNLCDHDSLSIANWSNWFQNVPRKGLPEIVPAGERESSRHLNREKSLNMSDSVG